MPCPICLTGNPAANGFQDRLQWDCPRCGSFAFYADKELMRTEDQTLEAFLSKANTANRRARLSHIVRSQYDKLPPSVRHVPVRFTELSAWQLDDALPDAAESLDRTILWIGDRQPSYLEPFQVTDAAPLEAWVGAPIRPSPGQVVGWFIKQPGVDKLIEIRSNGYCLTLDGWRRYHQLKREVSESRLGFIAMKFDKPDVQRALAECFKPAALEAGFDLKPVNEDQGAGLIDDQMRVALRRARFVVADLTHASRGAYWEAGFAEALGKPVIYTCHHDHWRPSEGREGSHFDTNHLVTVIWDPDKLDKARRQLTATIRATLPDEAKLE